MRVDRFSRNWNERMLDVKPLPRRRSLMVRSDRVWSFFICSSMRRLRFLASFSSLLAQWPMAAHDAGAESLGWIFNAKLQTSWLRGRDCGATLFGGQTRPGDGSIMSRAGLGARKGNKRSTWQRSHAQAEAVWVGSGAAPQLARPGWPAGCRCLRRAPINRRSAGQAGLGGSAESRSASGRSIARWRDAAKRRAPCPSASPRAPRWALHRLGNPAQHAVYGHVAELIKHSPSTHLPWNHFSPAQYLVGQNLTTELKYVGTTYIQPALQVLERVSEIQSSLDFAVWNIYI